MLFAKLQKVLESFCRKPTVRLAGYGVSLLLLGGGLFWSLQGLALNWQALNYTAGLGALFLAGLSLVLSAERFRHLALSLGVNLARQKVYVVVVYAGVANLLPIPGNIMVRWYALTREAGARLSTISNFLIALLWVGTALLFAGAGFYALGYLPASILAWTMGVLLSVAFVVMQCMVARQRKSVMAIALLQVTMTLVYIARLWLLSWFVGIDVAVSFCAIMSLSALAGSASGFFPGGMGIVEVFGAVLAMAVSVMPEKAFLLLALSRCMTIMTLLVGFFYIRASAQNARDHA